MIEKTHLLGKTVRNILTEEKGTVASIQAWDVDGAPGVFVEVPVIKADGRRHPHMFRVWRIDEVEEVVE